VLAGATRIDGNTAGDQGGGIFVRLPEETASLTFQVADGTPSYTDPLTGSTLPAWTGSVSGNTPDQCFPVLTLGAHTCGSTFE
jgi:predicted outer membrane repeat protein